MMYNFKIIMNSPLKFKINGIVILYTNVNNRYRNKLNTNRPN